MYSPRYLTLCSQAGQHLQARVLDTSCRAAQTRAKAKREFAEQRARAEARQQFEINAERQRRARYGQAGHHTRFAEGEFLNGEPCLLLLGVGCRMKRAAKFGTSSVCIVAGPGKERVILRGQQRGRNGQAGQHPRFAEGEFLNGETSLQQAARSCSCEATASCLCASRPSRAESPCLSCYAQRAPAAPAHRCAANLPCRSCS